jgi:hypothetical protein
MQLLPVHHVIEMECIAAHHVIVMDAIEVIMIQRGVRIIVQQDFLLPVITVIDSQMHHGIKHALIIDFQSLPGNMPAIRAVHAIQIQSTSELSHA